MAGLLLLTFLPTLGAQSIADLYGRAQQALARGDLSSAETACRAVLAIAPNDPGAHVNLGVVYMRRKRWDAALQELQTGQRLAPNVPGIWLDVALVYYHQNRFDLAVPQLEKVTRADPANAQAIYLLALCDVFTERYADAVLAPPVLLLAAAPRLQPPGSYARSAYR